MFDQSPYLCKVEWGPRGAREAAERGDITIIVDVLSFSSTVVTAVSHGAAVFPYPPPINEAAQAYADQVDAKLVLGRAEAARVGGYTLSPLSFGARDVGQRFVMCSLNGAVCAWAAAQVPALLVGCFLNASAVAEAANALQARTGAAISVIACGERWSAVADNENNMRPGIEDYLSAGLIMSKLNGPKSAEAQVCVGAYQSAEDNLYELIRDCGSGRELRERGYEADVKYCAQTDIEPAVPLLQGNRFVKWTGWI